ncbi:MAG: hypothetical protein RIS70_2645 [Planctomycetota bacterium]|jgi:hypothetical protein
MITTLIARLTGTDKLRTLAETIASQVSDAVWQRVRNRVTSLGANEARGYVRVRAIPVLRERIESGVDSRELTSRASQMLFDFASELVVQSILQRTAVAPSRPAILRRAA